MLQAHPSLITNEAKEGHIRAYAEQMETADEQMWLKIASHVFETKDKRRNELCYCGSGKKYKQRHEMIDQRLELIGKQKVLNDFNNIGLI